MLASNATPSRTGRDLFWAQPPILPLGLRLAQLESIVVPRRGRGGESVFDIARLQTPSASALLVIAFRSPATGKDAVAARDQLRTVVDDLRRRSAATSTAGLPYLPVLATEVATPTVIDACVREGLGVIDRRGTLILHGGPVYVHVEGDTPVERTSRVRLFSGKGCRIVRALLAQPGQRVRPAELATTARTSYAFAHGVLTKLERDGFVARSSPRSGFQVRDAAGLLKSWISSGERTAIRVTPYFAPSTRPEALAAAEAAAQASNVKTVFTLASALLPGEAFVAGLPHGLYVSGDVSPIEEALKLEPATMPHNFLVLRSEPAAETPDAGIYGFTRALPYGAGVALPQLASDFATAGGRGREQAERLVELYAKALPPPELEP